MAESHGCPHPVGWPRLVPLVAKVSKSVTYAHTRKSSPLLLSVGPSKSQAAHIQGVGKYTLPLDGGSHRGTFERIGMQRGLENGTHFCNGPH